MNNTDKSFINRISHSLENFTWNGDKANFRCPYCGDSTKNKDKKRAWLLQHKSDASLTIMKCFNCDKTTNLARFIKDNASEHFKDYLYEKFLYKRSNINVNKPIQAEPINNINKNLSYENIKQYSLDISNTPGENYIKGRLIDKSKYKDFRYVSNVGKFLKDINIKEYDKLKYNNNSAIIIPFFSFSGELYAFQFRFLEGNLRYITVKINKEIDYKIWGLEQLDINKTFYVCEGVFDAASLPNAIAMCGATINYDFLEEFKENCVFIFDNEKNNKDIINHMKTTLNKGYKLFIWENVQSKDINNYLTTYKNINTFIMKKPVIGLKGKMEIEKWLKKRTLNLML
jgi:hypothetical protein